MLEVFKRNAATAAPLREERAAAEEARIQAFAGTADEMLKAASASTEAMTRTAESVARSIPRTAEGTQSVSREINAVNVAMSSATADLAERIREVADAPGVPPTEGDGFLAGIRAA